MQGLKPGDQLLLVSANKQLQFRIGRVTVQIGNVINIRRQELTALAHRGTIRSFAPWRSLCTFGVAFSSLLSHTVM
jgi:hypothetical protein